MESVATAAEPFLGMKPGWPKRALYMTLGLAPFFGAMFLDLPMCPSAAAFGIPCPGCGLTRATLAALHGHFAQAFHYHPLFLLVTPVYVFVLSSLAWGYIRGGMDKIPSQRTSVIVSTLAIVIFISLFGVWLARFFGAFGGPVPVVRFN